MRTVQFQPFNDETQNIASLLQTNARKYDDYVVTDAPAPTAVPVPLKA